MPFSLVWMPNLLQAAGLKVAAVDGWEARGRGDFGTATGVICHHTAGPRLGNMPSLGVLIKGRSDLAGPLAQLGLGRDGTYYVIAAGRCNHAGEGSWQGIKAGNTNFIGIEAENTGGPDDIPWPLVQLQSYQRGVAAILKHIGRGAEFCAGHKEYALPNGRKTDPNLEMNDFRRAVTGYMSGAILAPPPIPVAEEAHPVDGGVGRPTLRRGDKGELVMTVQRSCGVEPTGDFDAKTEAAVRQFQREHDLVPDGIVGPKTWAVL
jgi:peptidoglycan hydrolase-like protein with peptidoglycan-binding domain